MADQIIELVPMNDIMTSVTRSVIKNHGNIGEVDFGEKSVFASSKEVDKMNYDEYPHAVPEVQEDSTGVDAQNRRKGQHKVYMYYGTAMGPWNWIVFMALAMIYVFGIAFQRKFTRKT